jgi:hypothetical protein
MHVFLVTDGFDLAFILHHIEVPTPDSAKNNSFTNG